jgi:hypothetical protein
MYDIEFHYWKIGLKILNQIWPIYTIGQTYKSIYESLIFNTTQCEPYWHICVW